MAEDKDEEIRKRAYALWESEGQPEGKQEEHWERARQEIEAATPAKPARARKKKTGETPVRGEVPGLPPFEALGNEGSTA